MIRGWSNYLENDYCYNCKSKTQRDYLQKWEYDEITKEYFILANCHICAKLFLYIYVEDRPKGVKFPSSMVSGITPVKLVTVFPKFSESKTNNVPIKIVASYSEGLRCMDNNAPNGATAMFRRALQQVCVDKGAKKGNRLEDQIKVLPNEIRPSATELRKWGNLASHEDSTGIIESVKMPDAELAKEFIERVFYAVYEYPAKISKSQKKRSGS